MWYLVIDFLLLFSQYNGLEICDPQSLHFGAQTYNVNSFESDISRRSLDQETVMMVGGTIIMGLVSLWEDNSEKKHGVFSSCTVKAHCECGHQEIRKTSPLQRTDHTCILYQTFRFHIYNKINYIIQTIQSTIFFFAVRANSGSFWGPSSLCTWVDHSLLASNILWHYTFFSY